MTPISNDLERYIRSVSRSIATRNHIPNEQEDLQMEGTIAALAGGGRARVAGAMIDYLRRQYGRSGRPPKRLLYFGDLADVFTNTQAVTMKETAMAGYFLPKGWSEALSTRENQVLRMKYWQDKNSRMTAQSLGLSEGRVSQLHSSALDKLRVWFNKG